MYYELKKKKFTQLNTTPKRHISSILFKKRYSYKEAPSLKKVNGNLTTIKGMNIVKNSRYLGLAATHQASRFVTIIQNILTHLLGVFFIINLFCRSCKDPLIYPREKKLCFPFY